MSLSRARLLATLLATVSIPMASAAFAAGPQAPGKPINRQPQAGNRAETARTRARAGDCKGALDAFDEALKTSTEPTLFRDRGFCHEQLGEPFPAIDDYRQYLVLLPDGPDAEQVRQRLAKLDALVAATAKADDAPRKTPAVSAGMAASGNVSVSTKGSDEAAPATSKVDAVEADERAAQQAYASPVREASGWALGPYFGLRRFGNASFGTNEAVGAAFRYSLNRMSTILTEIGYVHVNTGGTATAAGGPGLFVGYEARIPLSIYMGNAFLLGGGLGFERYSQPSSGIVFNALIPRGRIGVRHVFGATVGLELTGDVGVAYFFSKGITIDSPVTPVFGGYVGLVVGF